MTTFNEAVKQLARQQREEVIRSLSGRGQYRLLSQYSHFAVPTATWARMRPAQRSEVVNRFDKATIKTKLPQLSEIRSDGQGPSTPSAVSEVLSNLTETSKNQLSVSVERCGISKLALTTVQFMWEKAEQLISTENAIILVLQEMTTNLRWSFHIPHQYFTWFNVAPMANTSVMKSALIGVLLEFAHIPLLLLRPWEVWAQLHMQVVYKRLADLIADKLHKPYSTIIQLIRCRLRFSLLCSTITCLRGSRRPKTNFSGLFTTDPALVVAEGRVPF